MKRILTSITIFLLISISSFSQVSLEFGIEGNQLDSYNKSWHLGYLPDYGAIRWMCEHVETQDGEIITTQYLLSIYSLQNQLIKKIDIASVGGSPIFNIQGIFNPKDCASISQYVFNQDSKIEFITQGPDGSTCCVYNEDLELICNLSAVDNCMFTIVNAGKENEENYKLVASYCGSYERVRVIQTYAIVGNPLKSRVATQVAEIKSMNSKFSVSPNPSNGYFEADMPKDFKGQINIVNSNGQLIKSLKVSNTLSSKVPINLEEQPSGIYFCLFITNNVVKSSVKIVLK